jgi:tRNA threonylcarbamoyladenosine biosynthesis protein TsaE
MYESNSVAETEAIAGEFARTLKIGTCIALHGELGAGKTQFVRGIIKGLGGDGRAVSSPTFILLHVYDCPALKIFHLDAYRVSGGEDFEAIGFRELLEQNGIVVVEWAARVASLLPSDTIWVSINATSQTNRQIEIQ